MSNAHNPPRDIPPPRNSQRHRRHASWVGVDSKLWGDSASVTIDVPVGAAPPATANVRQLVQAAVPSPVMWSIAFNSVGNQVPAGQVANITLLFRITIGCGKGQTTLLIPVVLLAANGFQPAPGLNSIQVPAQDIQVDCQVTGLAGPVGPVTYVINAAAMAAPLGRWDELLETE
jgi:hypothetical protein